MTEPKKTLYKKLAEITSEVGYIPKNGWNDFHKYKYATEADVQDAVRNKMSERNLFMFPNITDRSTRETTTNKGKTEYISWVQIEYTITDAESGEQLTFTMEGEGQDAGDKGIYKAITGTQKYAIMKLFMIPTGDDPEQATPETDDHGSGSSNKGGKGKTSGKPQQTAAEKKAADKEFFDRRDDLRTRIDQLALQKQTAGKEITDYVIGKANKILEKNHKAINSINIETAEKIMVSLEREAAAKDMAGDENAKQGEMLNERTNQPKK